MTAVLFSTAIIRDLRSKDMQIISSGTFSSSRILRSFHSLIDPIKSSFKQVRLHAPTLLTGCSLWLNGNFRQFFTKEFSSYSTGQCFSPSHVEFQQLLNPSRSSTEFSWRKARKLPTTRIDFLVVSSIALYSHSPDTLLVFSRIVTYPRRKQRIPSTQSSFPKAVKPRYKACLHLKTAKGIPKNLITTYNQDHVVARDEKFPFHRERRRCISMEEFRKVVK